MKAISVAEPIKLTDYCNVFQLEMLGIQAAFKIIWDSNLPNRNTIIPSYNQTVSSDLGFRTVNVLGVKDLNKAVKIVM